MSTAPQMPPEQRQKLAEALYAGRKIEAIKELREASGLGLAESKGIIDRLEAELRVLHPERFTAPPAAKGCSPAALVVALVILAALIFLVIQLRH